MYEFGGNFWVYIVRIQHVVALQYLFDAFNIDTRNWYDTNGYHFSMPTCFVICSPLAGQESNLAIASPALNWIVSLITLCICCYLLGFLPRVFSGFNLPWCRPYQTSSLTSTPFVSSPSQVVCLCPTWMTLRPSRPWPESRLLSLRPTGAP